MDKRISTQTKEELVGALGRRYVDFSIIVKTRILDESVAVSGYHRKHAIRLFGEKVSNSPAQTPPIADATVGGLTPQPLP